MGLVWLCGSRNRGHVWRLETRRVASSNVYMLDVGLPSKTPLAALYFASL